MQPVLFWLSTYVFVFLLGLQSRSVNNGRYLLAALTSMGISTVQLVFIRGLVQIEPVTVWLLSITAAPLGIVSSMAVSRYVLRHGENPSVFDKIRPPS
jgi:hypothetical protein